MEEVLGALKIQSALINVYSTSQQKFCHSIENSESC